MRQSRVRLLRSAIVAVVVAALAAGALGSAAGSAGTGERSPRPRVVVVLDWAGCPDADTLRLCQGMMHAMRRTGVRGRIVTPTIREDLADVLALLARQRYEAIVLFGLYFDPAVAAVARRYPHVPFVVIDGSRANVRKVPRNVQGVVLRTREAAFLAGWLAAKLERRRHGPDVVGVVGGLPVPSVTDFVQGFAIGARRAAPGVRVLVDYSYDWVDPQKCAALARRQIARGAGTVFNVAGACGLGTMQAAADARVWTVGVDTDQSRFGRHVLTSVLKSFEAGFVDVLRQVKAGHVRAGRDTVLTMRDGATGLGRISPRVPRQLRAQLDALRRGIIAGEIHVPGVAS